MPRRQQLLLLHKGMFSRSLFLVFLAERYFVTFGLVTGDNPPAHKSPPRGSVKVRVRVTVRTAHRGSVS